MSRPKRKLAPRPPSPCIRSRRLPDEQIQDEARRLIEVADTIRAGRYHVPASEIADAILEEADRLAGALLS